MFRFKGKAYEIKESYLAAYVGDAFIGGDYDNPVTAIIWDFSVAATRALEGEEEFPDEIWVAIHDSPSFVSVAGTIERWQDVIGVRVELKDQYEWDPDVLVYEGEHIALVSGYFEIYGDAGGAVRLRLKGECDSGYGWAVLEVDAPLPFKGFWMGREGEARAMQKLASVLDPEAFTFVQNEEGVSVCVPKQDT